jgi:hypothetical protein
MLHKLRRAYRQREDDWEDREGVEGEVEAGEKLRLICRVEAIRPSK